MSSIALQFHKLPTTAISFKRSILTPSLVYSLYRIPVVTSNKIYPKQQNRQFTTKEKQRLVIALGGNALLKRGEPLTIDVQRKNIKYGIIKMKDMLNDNNVILVHGNGPQVGLLALQNDAYNHQQKSNNKMNLDVLDAETEGMIGYMIEQELHGVIQQQPRGIVTILSQILVNPKDEAFSNPTKFIGPVYTQTEMEDILKDNNESNTKAFKPDGSKGYYRQVVPSPKPIKLLDEQMIALKLLINNNCLVICAGGGGIPIIEKNNQIQGIEAVIDKDMAASMLATSLDANGLVILTDVKGVALGYDTEEMKWIKCASPDVMRGFLKEFPAGSMGPKVESCIDFVDNGGGKWAMIASLENANEVIEHASGTLITNEYGSGHLEFY